MCPSTECVCERDIIQTIVGYRGWEGGTTREGRTESRDDFRGPALGERMHLALVLGTGGHRADGDGQVVHHCGVDGGVRGVAVGVYNVGEDRWVRLDMHGAGDGRARHENACRTSAVRNVNQWVSVLAGETG